ncbi:MULTISPECIES: YdcH family protein [Vibrio]|uniref:YdcH family protein n=1 Tax=Vibrio qingdaonensis TaxID=2829491 RepID=A0A9X3CSJ7_9VIBR|nr:YdcH family protein [Vibrio qingdaonensis]MCW8348898.1 YdcH family protein [Vibrio qingdaonensis]
MLGENHSLLKEFPDFQSTILELMKSDESFASTTKKYDALDKEIRVLELNGAPIDDAAMHQLKHERAVLKDVLHKHLVELEK